MQKDRFYTKKKRGVTPSCAIQGIKKKKVIFIFILFMLSVRCSSFSLCVCPGLILCSLLLYYLMVSLLYPGPCTLLPFLFFYRSTSYFYAVPSAPCILNPLFLRFSHCFPTSLPSFSYRSTIVFMPFLLYPPPFTLDAFF
ncbi:MAG: hypothetical protein PWQ77_1578 [Kosmotogales bacterium]|nr:hypothetical protein [Kosmotogales bacterium]